MHFKISFLALFAVASAGLSAAYYADPEPFDSLYAREAYPDASFGLDRRDLYSYHAREAYDDDESLGHLNRRDLEALEEAQVFLLARGLDLDDLVHIYARTKEERGTKRKRPKSQDNHYTGGPASKKSGVREDKPHFGSVNYGGEASSSRKSSSGSPVSGGLEQHVRQA